MYLHYRFAWWHSLKNIFIIHTMIIQIRNCLLMNYKIWLKFWIVWVEFSAETCNGKSNLLAMTSLFMMHIRKSNLLVYLKRLPLESPEPQCSLKFRGSSKQWRLAIGDDFYWAWCGCEDKWAESVCVFLGCNTPEGGGPYYVKNSSNFDFPVTFWRFKQRVGKLVYGGGCTE